MSTKSYREVRISKAKRAAKRKRKQHIVEAIEAAGLHIEQGTVVDYQMVGVICRDVLIPTLLPNGYVDLVDCHHELEDEDEWCWESILAMVEEPDKWIREVRSEDGATAQRRLSARSVGRLPARQHAAHIINQAFESLECIAEAEAYVRSDISSEAEARGHAIQIGHHLRGYDLDLGDPVQIISDASGLTKTLMSGGTGQGKSSAVDIEAWDRHKSGRKLIDLIDFVQGESFFYDVPQMDNALRHVREEMGFPPDFGDEEPPKIEILVPMTPGLEEEELAYNIDGQECVITPFTIPASEIREALLVALMMSLLSPQQEATIRSAYQKVTRANDDWTLKDLADEIGDNDELGPELAARAVSVLSMLQHQGFVRDKTCKYTLDWDRIFSEHNTITVFSCAYMDDLASKLMATGYLLHECIERRKGLKHVRPTTLIARELWKIAPHNQRQSFDSRAASLQEAIGSMLSEIMREGRHHGMEFLADTQYPSDLVRSVRPAFNRYVVFQLGKKEIKDIFDWTSNDEWRSFYDSLNSKPGQASVVGMTEPSVNRDHIEFVGPVQYAPPPFHHFDVDSDWEGCDSRARYLDNEELRVPKDEGVEWADDTEVPEYLLFDGDASTVERTPMEEFVASCIRVTGDRATYVTTVDVRDSYRRYAQETGAPEIKSSASFGRNLSTAMKSVHEVDELDNDPRSEGRAYIGIVLTEKGEFLLDKWRGDAPDA